MRLLRAPLALVLVAAAFGGPAAAKDRPSAGYGAESVHTAAWPAVPAQLAKNIATASFAHDYGRVWSYLHPAFRDAVSQAHWRSCQGSHPAAPRSVTIKRVSVANATELPIRLSLLGRRNVQEIQLVIRFERPGSAAPQLALLYTFWLKQGDTWRAVWLSDEYAAYKAGRCYLTPEGPPLY